jgi:hypothetical protein
MNGIRHSPSFPLVTVLLGGKTARGCQRLSPPALHQPSETTSTMITGSALSYCNP